MSISTSQQDDGEYGQNDGIERCDKSKVVHIDFLLISTPGLIVLSLLLI